MVDGSRTRALAFEDSAAALFVAFWDYLSCKCCPGALSAPSGRISLDIRPNMRAGQGVTAPPASIGGGLPLARAHQPDRGGRSPISISAPPSGASCRPTPRQRSSARPLLPAVNFTGFAQRFRNPGGPVRDVFQAALNASYEIDFWGKNRAASRAAQEIAVATRFDKEVVVLSTIVSVGAAYFQVLSSQDRLRIARQNLAAANRVLTLVKQRFEAGTASRLDVPAGEPGRSGARDHRRSTRRCAEHRRARRADPGARRSRSRSRGSLYQLTIRG
jgi:hypothetical protein